ncbi:MAG: DUF2939 domain-containing protein [Pseudomonadota bacterium]
MKKLLALLLLAMLALAAYVAAGPFIALHAIRDDVQRGDMRGLERHVDFPLVRASVRAQLEDYIARRMAEPDLPAELRGIGAQVTQGLAGGVVDLLVTPAGIGAVLQGRSIVRRVMGLPPERTPSGEPQPGSLDPLADARYRFESTSRFTATVQNADGAPVVFVFSRDGLRWRMTDVRLPIDALIGNLTR